MIRRVLNVFRRDLKVNSREFLSLYIIVFPIILGVCINLFSPGVNDTTVNIAMLNNDIKQIEYYRNYAKVETFDSIEKLKERVQKRDSIIGIVKEKDGESYILAQGNEHKEILEMTKLLKSFYELGYDLKDTNVTLHSFNRTVPPLKKILVNASILLISILGGMIITMNMVEEKSDNTVSALLVTPLSRRAFIIGKCLMGVLLSLIGAVLLLVITGFTGIDFAKTIFAVMGCTFISIIIGFVQGVGSDDVMEAVAGLKLMFLPMIGAILAIEMLSDKWQKFFYWIPFYWTYKANDSILSGTAVWSQTIIYTGIVVGLTLVMYILLAPRIRRGLEK